jgi:high-affinity iron transporter
LRTAAHPGRRRGFGLAAAAIAALALASAAAAAAAPWEAAGDLRTALTDAEKALILDGPGAAAQLAGHAATAAHVLVEAVRTAAPVQASRIERGLDAALAAASAGDGPRLAAARAEVWTAVLAASFRLETLAVRRGEVETARQWLLVREFRKPTRFSRPGADATLALTALAEGASSSQKALAAVRADLLDTYQARLRATLDLFDEASSLGYPTRTAGLAALARGYFLILDGAYRAQRGPVAAQAAEEAFDRLAASALAGDAAALATARTAVDRVLEGFRAAPLSAEEEVRRAGQVQRFLALVPVEYARGVDGGRVTLEFEIQEAITFRDGAAQAYGDLEAALAQRDEASTRRLGEVIDELGDDLGAAARGERVADPDDVRAKTDAALRLAATVFPDEWRGAGAAADFDVIRTSLDRLEGAVKAGEHARAEQARLEAYAFFEFGPEQRLRGLAPNLFVEVEGLFWYGADGLPGLAQLITRKAGPEEVAATRKALDTALANAEAAVGSGPKSTVAVVTNTAVIVFREGLEAVLIVAALIAGLVGAQRRFRRPLLLGVAGALLATVATWVVAQTVIGSLARYGEKLEAAVSLVAVGVLLLVLNWFYHRVYWNERLAEFHGRKKRLVRAGLVGAATAQVLGLAALGFSSVYREGFETVLFLQALVLEAGVGGVLLGVALGLVGVAGIAVVTIALQRKLPHRKMLIATGILILGVLVVMVGTTVQTLQVVGWLSVHPIPGVHLPYWAGLWLGVFPTWEGVAAQGGAAAIVLGSYFLAERLRARRRRAILAGPLAPAEAARRAEPRGAQRAAGLGELVE